MKIKRIELAYVESVGAQAVIETSFLYLRKVNLKSENLEFIYK